MYCILKNEMKFDDVIVPSRTKCRIISHLKSDALKETNTIIELVIDNYFLGKVNIENENNIVLSDKYKGDFLSGYYVVSNIDAIYLDASDEKFCDNRISKDDLNLIFGEENIPKVLKKIEEPTLFDVVYCLESAFSEWVNNSCDFKIVTEDDIEANNEYDAFNPGDKILTIDCVPLYNSKKLEYQNKLEKIGYTYDFKGGLLLM